MTTQSRCQIALKFPSTDTKLQNESLLAEEYDHGDDGEREKEIKDDRELDGNSIQIIAKTVQQSNKKRMLSK